MSVSHLFPAGTLINKKFWRAVEKEYKDYVAEHPEYLEVEAAGGCGCGNHEHGHEGCCGGKGHKENGGCGCKH